MEKKRTRDEGKLIANRFVMKAAQSSPSPTTSSRDEVSKMCRCVARGANTIQTRKNCLSFFQIGLKSERPSEGFLLFKGTSA